MPTPPPGPASRPAPRPAPSFAAGLARSTGWIVGGTYAERLLGLLSTLVITRLLTPEDFGVFAIGMVFMQLVTGFTEVGLSMAVVKFRDASDDDMDTLFTIGLLRGLLLGAVMLGAGPVAVAIYGDPRLLGVFWGLAGVPVLTGLINPRFYEFERDGDFSREFVSMLARKVVAVALTIGLALWLGSYVAIVAGVLVGAAMQVALSFAFRPKLPRLTLASLPKVFGFTGWITLVAIFAALNNKLDVMFFGRLVGEGGAGQLYLGSQLAELPTRDVSIPLARAIYPGLSERQDDPEAVRVAFLQGCQALAMLALPASVGFALVADLALPILVGDQWGDAVPVIQIFGPVLGLQTVFAATQGYAMSVGRVIVVGRREATFFFLRTPVILYALWAHGFRGGVAAVACMGLVHCVLNSAAYRQLSGKSALHPVMAAHRSLVGCAAMAAAVFGVRALLPAGLPDPVTLLTLIATGGTAFALTQGGLWLAEGRPSGVEATVLRVAQKGLQAKRPATPA